MTRTSWPDLLAIALMGTDRRAAGDAGTLLEEAAAWSVYRRAGARPLTGLPAPEPAPVDLTPVVLPAAANRLAALADPDQFGDATIRLALLTEWLTVAARAGWRIPPELLPDLLDQGRRQPEVRRLIVAAGGERVAWLARQNPGWKYILSTVERTVALDDAAADPAIWDEGTRSQRVTYLTALRRADPTAGRALLAGEWANLPSDERVELVATLAAGLGPDDEAFLEAALDDRRREVRTVVADLLASLSSSAYNARMAERGRPCLTLQDGRILVRPPAECDEGMRRDGINPKPPAGLGARAWWLEQLLARTPLSIWQGGDPGFLQHSIEEGWDGVVLRGLARAAGAQRNPVWAGALLDLIEPRLRADTTPAPALRWPVAQLYPALGRDELVRRAIEAVRDDTARLGRLIEYVLEQCPAPWPGELATAVIAGLEAHSRRKRMPYDLYRVCRIAALRTPPAFAAEAIAAADRVDARPEHTRVGGVFEQLAGILQLRHEMIQELA